MFKKGDKVYDKKDIGFIATHFPGTIIRVAKDGSWADVAWGSGWATSSRRMPTTRLSKKARI